MMLRGGQLMASIRKRNKRWEVRIRRNGRPTQTKTFTLKSDANKWAREIEVAIENGQQINKSNIVSMTLLKATQRYMLETKLIHRGARSERYRFNTILKVLDQNAELSSITASPPSKYMPGRHCYNSGAVLPI